MTLTLAAAGLILVVLCLLAIGHQHNQIEALTRRVNANALAIETLANRPHGLTLGEIGQALQNSQAQAKLTADRMGRKVLAAHAARRAN